MVDLLRHLNNKIVINDLIVKKMKYEVNMLFYDYPSKEKAKLLAIKINGQLDTALIGLNEEDKEQVRRNLIQNSFLIIPNPVSDNINYGHVFTTLTNFDHHINTTENRLTQWLDLNAEVNYDENVIRQYITKYKVMPEQPDIKMAAIDYVPNQVDAEPHFKYRLRKRVIWIPISLICIFFLSSFLNKEAKLKNDSMVIPPLYQNTLSPEVESFIDSYYESLKNISINPYQYQALEFSKVYQYLKTKKSALVEADYLSIIDAHAASYDVNPLLLIAIIGQEQNYVPNDHEDKSMMINNPYNVFGSWIDYNTTFEEATVICLNTIDTAVKSLPEASDLVDWLNESYAEDKNWSIGVKTIFTKLQSLY